MLSYDYNAFMLYNKEWASRYLERKTFRKCLKTEIDIFLSN